MYSQVSSKFIPTFLVKYCGPGNGKLSPAETARYDLLITNYHHHHAWAEDGMNSWNTLKSYNPDMIVALYMLGPGLYNTASWGEIGQGWEWMKEHHGATSGNEQWTASGHRFSYLAPQPSPNERLMNIGNTDWQRYWIDTVYHDFMLRIPENARGVDAVFADNTHYKVIWQNRWYDEEHVGDPSFLDHPIHYADSSGKYDNDKWRSDTRAFLNLASYSLNQKAIPLKLLPNFGYSGSNPEYWANLDSLQHPLHAAMEEAGFVCPWAHSYSVWDWKRKVDVMKNMKNTAVLMTCMGQHVPGTGLEKMDSVMSAGNMGPTTGWEALWYSICSFLLALNEEKSNGYLTFTAWGYCENHWLDEFDARYLHLGDPLGDYYIIDGVAYREFDDGWVVVNTPHNGHKSNLPVPFGRARVITHSNFKHADDALLVTHFDIDNYRGLILLREGKKIGNEDNISDVPDIPESKEVLTVFPNPFQNRITLNANTRISHVIVYDMLGNVVMEQETNSNTTTISLSGLTSNVYIIQAYSGDVPSSSKVVRIR